MRSFFYLDDGSTGCSSKTLCDDIEQSLQNAAVAADQQTTCYSWIDVTTANVTECLQVEMRSAFVEMSGKLIVNEYGNNFVLWQVQL